MWSKEYLVGVTKSRKTLKIVLGVVFVLCFIGTVVGIPIAVTFANGGKDTNKIREIPKSGWNDWSEWTDCSVTCGDGQISRSKDCVINEESDIELCNTETEDFQVKSCFRDACLTGKVMVSNETEKAVTAGVEDYLFLRRYAQAVTNNGENVNTEDVENVGYGAWRLTSNDFDEILRSESRDLRANTISLSLVFNFNLVCAGNLTSIDLSDALQLATAQPCFSMVALITYLKIKGWYPLPLNWADQENILNQITDHVLQNWGEVLNGELVDIQENCLQADTDFEFVIDSSGSVGVDNWQLTMSLIGEYWIKQVLIPNGSNTCGNHVAGRWFSRYTERFFDFEPISRDNYPGQSYAEYTGNYFTSFPYNTGSTNTQAALKAVREEDLPMARNGLKYVMVFTDGESNVDSDQTPVEANKLHKEADRTYAFGITDGPNEEELKAIASEPRFMREMKNFADLQAFVRIFILEQRGCSTISKKPYRAVDVKSMRHFGMSYQTALNVDNQQICTDMEICPVEEETRRSKGCTDCSENIAQQHRPLLDGIKYNVTEAAMQSCFPPEIVLALVSRLSVEDGTFMTGWQPCRLKHYWYQQCYGLMHIPKRFNPDDSIPGDSIEHFLEGISVLTELTSQITQRFRTFTPIEQTRAALATYDAGPNAVEDKDSIDKKATNGDFSADIMGRAKRCINFLF